MTRKINWDAAEIVNSRDCEKLLGALSDNIARALDKAGWMIVLQPGLADDPSSPQKWPMDSASGYVPEWAEDIRPSAKVIQMK